MFIVAVIKPGLTARTRRRDLPAVLAPAPLARPGGRPAQELWWRRSDRSPGAAVALRQASSLVLAFVLVSTGHCSSRRRITRPRNRASRIAARSQARPPRAITAPMLINTPGGADDADDKRVCAAAQRLRGSGSPRGRIGSVGQMAGAPVSPRLPSSSCPCPGAMIRDRSVTIATCGSTLWGNH
jgi:hypothetical protein